MCFSRGKVLIAGEGDEAGFSSNVVIAFLLVFIVIGVVFVVVFEFSAVVSGGGVAGGAVRVIQGEFSTAEDELGGGLSMNQEASASDKLDRSVLARIGSRAQRFEQICCTYSIYTHPIE